MIDCWRWCPPYGRSLSSELREHTYYAKLRIRREGELLEIDSRPSDAIAVAVTCLLADASSWIVSAAFGRSL